MNVQQNNKGRNDNRSYSALEREVKEFIVNSGLINNIEKKRNYSAPRLGYINFWSKQRKYNFCFIIALLRKVDNFSM